MKRRPEIAVCFHFKGTLKFIPRLVDLWTSQIDDWTTREELSSP